MKNNLRILVDGTIPHDFLLGSIKAIKETSLNKQTYILSSCGPNFPYLLNLFYKKDLTNIESCYRSVTNTIRKEEPFIFLSLAEIKNNEKPKPTYFVLNGKDRNYLVKLLSASTKKGDNSVIINGNSYYSCSTLDPLPFFPILSDFERTFAIAIVNEENYEDFLERANKTPLIWIVVVMTNDLFEEGYDLTKKTLVHFFKTENLIKKFGKNSEDIPTINTLYKK